MYKALIFFVGVYLTTFTNALFDKDSNVKKVSNTIDLISTFLDPEYLTVVYFHTNDKRSEAMGLLFNELAKRRKQYYKFFAVDCDSIQKDVNKAAVPACHEDFKDALPQILLLEPQHVRSNVHSNRTLEPIQHRYEGDLNIDEFDTFAKKLMPSYSERLVSLEHLEKFLSDQPTLKKAIFLTNKKSIPRYWKALSAHFKGRLMFGEALSKGYLIHEKYNITKFPAVIVTQKAESGPGRWVTYDGNLDHEKLKDADFEKLETFLGKFASETKVLPRMKVDHPTEPTNPQEGLAPPKDLPKPVVKDFIPERFEEIVYGTEGLVMIHVYRADDRHSSFDDVVTKFSNLIDIYDLNCDDAKALKFAEDELQIQYFPGYRLYPVGNKKAKAKSKIIYTKIKNFMDIATDISNIIGNPTTFIASPEELNSHLEKVVSESKPTLVLFHNQDEISMSLRVLAQLERYKNWINFANYKNPPAEVRQKLNFEQLPRLVMIFAKDPSRKDVKSEDNLQTALYRGKFAIDELREFLDTFLPTEIRTLTLSQMIPQVDIPQDFYLLCQNKHIPCAIGLIDGYSANDGAKTRVKRELTVLESVQSDLSHKQLTFVWVDAACHSELISNLGVSAEFPSIVYYEPLSKVLIQYSSSFDSDKIVDFLEESLKGSSVQFIKTLAEVPQLEQKNCAEFHSARDPQILKKLSPKSQSSAEKSNTKKPSKQKSSGKDEL